MRVVVFNERQPERDAIARGLERASHEVHVASDKTCLLAALTQRRADVAILGWKSAMGAATVRAARDACPEAYVLVMIDAGADIAPLLAMGAHDVLRRPILTEEVVARVEAPQRFREWLKVLGDSSGPDLRKLQAWQSLGALVSSDLGQLLGVALAHDGAWPEQSPARLQAATIAMSLAAHKIELRISIAVDDVGRAWLGQTVLGDAAAPDAALSDVLCELANTAGGAVKRAALSEDTTLTTGLPMVDDDELPLPNGDTIAGWVLRTGEGFVAIHAEIRTRENRRVPASRLAEGMVLVSDLRTSDGALLVAAGTRLTSTTAQRVATIVGERFVVEVAAA